MDTIYQTQWYNSLKKSPLTPPSTTFGIVWPILYIMMAVAAFMVWKECGGLCTPLYFFFAQLAFNLIWTTVFFRQQNISGALLVILVTLGLTVYTIYLFYPINQTSAWLLVPYAAWLAFASYLNWYIYRNN